MAKKGFLITQIQQKQKKLEYWRKGYLKALEEVRNAKKVLQEVIEQSESVLSEPKNWQEINKEFDLNNRKVQKDVNDSLKKHGIDLGTINTNIPKAPPMPEKKDDQVKKDPATSRASLNKEIQEKVREGIKPSDLKKSSKNIDMSNKTILNNVSVKKMQDPASSKDYFIITDESDSLGALRDDYAPPIYLCIKETMKTGWDELAENYGAVTTVEIDYEESSQGKKVVNLTIK